MQSALCEQKQISVPCHLEITGAGAVSAQTSYISIDNIFVKCLASSFVGNQPPRPGMVGVITLVFNYFSTKKSLKIKCNILRIGPSGIEIQTNYSALNATQQKIFNFLLETYLD